MSAANVSRRRFLQTAAAASTVFAVPQIIPARAFGANERVVTGHIGVKNRGGETQNLKDFRQHCAAVCDVDTKVMAAAVNYLQKSENKKVDTYTDYRKLLERKDIDAIIVSTPDHWHALMTIEACAAGKDVFCEKPLSLFISEGRKMVDAARKHGRIVQTGSQQRSDKRFRQACELVRNGALGKIEQVLVGIPGPNHAKDYVPDSAPPAELNYDLWLGPAPERPYNVNRVHYNFRFFWDYSGGQMTNFGAHHIDIAQWGLDMDGSGPIAAEGTATYPDDTRLCEVTKTCRVTLTYANGAKVIVGQGEKDIPGGCTFVGEKGRIFVDRSKITASDPEILKTDLSSAAVRLYKSDNHVQDFLNCIASRDLPAADVEIGHRTATACHLANMAARVGRKIEWDPSAEKVVGDEDAAAMADRPYRGPWKLA
jgi:predicted dehydrogenase